MKKHAKLLAIILGMSCLCGCSVLFKGYEKLDNPNESDPHVEVISYSDIKEGCYLSDSGDGSYYFIKDGKYTFLNYDWEKYYRETYPQGDMGASEYEENVREYVEACIEANTNKPFTPVRTVNYPASYPPIRLVTNPSPEDIESALQSSVFSMEFISMKDENTIGTEPPYYIYCGTSLPENVQTQTSD